MVIKEITSQSERDFWADMECDHCGHIEHHVSGYDDEFFHQNVIPTMKCKKCGKTSREDYEPKATKYDKNEIV